VISASWRRKVSTRRVIQNPKTRALPGHKAVFEECLHSNRGKGGRMTRKEVRPKMGGRLGAARNALVSEGDQGSPNW